MSNLSIGKYSYIVNHAILDHNHRGNKVIVGNYCSISETCIFLLDHDHNIDTVSTFPFNGHSAGNLRTPGPIAPSKGNIEIKNDVWIGWNVTIMGGVTIHDGAVITANSTVTKDVPPYSVHGGAPAKHIKYRFPIEIIDELRRIKWWDWEEDVMKEMMPYINSKDIKGFIDKCRETGL